MRRSTLDIDRDGETVTIGHGHDLGSFSTLRFSNLRSPFFAGAKLRVDERFLYVQTPRTFSSRARASRIPFITPERTHCWKRRW